jgi:hypothetical protein
MVLAAHFTQVKCGITTTLETVRFQRPHRIDFRLVRGPVPHLSESFLLDSHEQGTTFTWQGELATDCWAIGAQWGNRVARAWTRAVKASPGRDPNRSRTPRTHAAPGERRRSLSPLRLVFAAWPKGSPGPQ